MKLELLIPGVPVAQPRQRHRIVRSGERQFVSNYTPVKDPVNSWKAVARLVAADVAPETPLTDPCEVYVEFVFPRPRAKIWRSKAMPRYEHAGKPDIDNLLKSLGDALTGVIWADDKLIYRCTAAKWCASGSESPHCFVRVFSGDHA